MNQSRRLFSIVAILATLLLVQACSKRAPLPYQDPTVPAERRVEDLLSRMTPEEKADMLAGAGWMESRANTRLGIPSIRMADGPIGVRAWYGSSAETSAGKLPPINSTAFPVGIAMGATWDPELVAQEGRAIGQEAKALGRDQMLGPTVNIARVPQWGRNFEGYGEDPYLAARLGVGYIKGMQSAGTIATVKHYAANNQEFERLTINAKVDERALQEIYYPAFKAAVQDAKVWSVMSAYNKLNGKWCAENPDLLRKVLKDEWGFQGYVISDWGSTHSTAGSVNAGLDLEMPGGEPLRKLAGTSRAEGHDGGYLTKEKVLAAIQSGQLKQANVDDAVRRLLRVMFANGLFEKKGEVDPAKADIDTPEQRKLARTSAAESIVLLKNERGTLPLAADKIHSIAVIGPNAAVDRTGGGGSSSVRPKYTVSPLDGIRERAGSPIQVNYALGVGIPGEDPSKDTPEARAAALKEAVALAKKSDLVLLFAGDSNKIESEGFDRKSLDLPEGQDQLIQAVAKANPKTIVVLNIGSPVAMDKWLNQVPAVVNAWFPGQEGGHAIADVLFGDVNPSGKLPVSFPKQWKDSAAYGHYPGQNGEVDYAEGIYVGYRYFDKHNLAPLFPFGFGLSYTTFSLSDLQLTPASVTQDQPVQISVTVRNTGTRAGAEVVQLYLRDVKSSIDRPEKELKGFQRVELKPGESKKVTLAVDKNAMSFFDPAKKAWVAEPGAFEVMVGTSSREIKLKGTFELK